MQVTFIKPTLGRLGDDTRFVDEARMEPLSLGVLAGLTPAGVDVRLFDDRIDEIDYDERTDLVAINVETFTARRAYEISAEYRARGVPVVMGGMHATLVPDEVAEHADCVYTGDGESLWAQVVTDAHEGRLRPRYDAINGPPQPGALPRRDLYEGKGYLPVSLLQFGRGCHNRCEFCAVGAYFDHCHFTRPVDEVVAEIQAQSLKDLFFVDDNLVADPEAAKRLLRALAPLDVRWVSQASVEHTRDPELMQLMVDSGCLGNVIGFESLDPENLRQMHKGPNLPAFDRYAGAVTALRDHHLQTWAAFVLGYDHDTAGVDTGDVRLGHREPLHLRGFQRADALSVDAALRPAESRGAPALRRALVAAPRLPIQLRGVQAFSDDRRRAHRGSVDVSSEVEQHQSRYSGARSSRTPISPRSSGSRSTARTTPCSVARRSRSRACTWGPSERRRRLRHAPGHRRRRTGHPRAGGLDRDAGRRGGALRPRAGLLPRHHDHGRSLRRPDRARPVRRPARRDRLPSRAAGLRERAGDADRLRRPDPHRA